MIITFDNVSALDWEDDKQVHSVLNGPIHIREWHLQITHYRRLSRLTQEQMGRLVKFSGETTNH